MIEVNHLVKKYGNHFAVNDVSFTVEKGKVYGLLGPNGAGKSTCMNIMTGYMAATSGEVKICGFDIVNEAEEAKQHIGYLPEIPPLYQDMTVVEYLCFVAELKKIKKSQRMEQVNEVMKKTFIEDMKCRLIKNLSKGYKQRVGLAQAMLGNPEIIILDEPTVGLDPKQILEIRDLILSLKEEHAVILSSHILSEVSAVCDEIMIISKGKMVACDTPEGLSGLMQGEDVLHLKIKGNQDSLEEILSSIDEVVSFSFEEEKEEGFTTASVHIEAGKEIRETICRLLSGRAIPIYEMNMQAKSLEDIFLELTENNMEVEHESDL